jgi:hypothetical protein
MVVEPYYIDNSTPDYLIAFVNESDIKKVNPINRILYLLLMTKL